MINYEHISRSPIFHGLNPQTVEELLHTANFQVKHYRPKATIALQDDSCNFLMMVLEGRVQAQMLDYSGKQVVMAEITPFFLIAPAFLYAGKNEFPVNVVALETTSVLFIHKADFTALLQQNTTVLHNYLRIISDRSKFLSEKIMFLGFKTIKGKIAAFLLQQYREQQNKTLNINITQQELADYLGVARPSLARVLHEMKEEGSLDIRRKQYILLNITLLQQEAQ